MVDSQIKLKCWSELGKANDEELSSGHYLVSQFHSRNLQEEFIQAVRNVTVVGIFRIEDIRCATKIQVY